MNTLPTVDYPAFRRKLAGLADPERRATPGEAVNYRNEATAWVVVLCRLFGDELDRLTLWSRIDTALRTAGDKAPEGDLDRWCDLCLEHVRADPGRAAADEKHVAWRTVNDAKDLSWKLSFVRWVASNPYAAVTHGRLAWEEYKKLHPLASGEGKAVAHE